ncbi:MAG: zinc metallopeptidase [Clostridia bacterium]|nr:zinc metallopeptidase [Clostridia bacterium]
MGFMYMDWYYLILVVPAMILALFAQIKVKSTYKKFSQVRNVRGITGAQAAQQVLSYYGINDVQIRPIGGNLTDNYNPKTKVLSLSQANYSGTSIAAVGVACHEVGHAIQHSTDYYPIKVRSALVPVTNIGSMAGIPLALLGYYLGIHPRVSIGLMLYSLIAIFKFVTLPVEFNASSRAIKAIDEMGLLYEDETKSAEKVLSAAALTYVASLVVSLANLLRLFLRFNNRR